MAIIMSLFGLVLGLGLYQEHANHQRNDESAEPCKTC